MSIDYVQWVADTLAKKPHLSQSGLARHLGRHRSIITLMMRGERQIKANELDRIAAYLGEPVPGRSGSTSTAGVVQVVGRCGAAWYERGSEPSASGAVAPVLREPYDTQRQVAYLIETASAGVPAGSHVVAVTATSAKNLQPGKLVVVERERAGLVNLALSRIETGGEVQGTVVAVVIEIRTPV